VLGAATVVGVEPNAYRRDLAAQRGATVIDPRAGDTAEQCQSLDLRRDGFDLAFEVSGVDGMIPLLLELVRREGTVVVVGHPGTPTSIDVARYITKKGVVLKGIFGRRLWETWDLAIDLIESGRIDPTELVTHRLAFHEIDDAIELRRTAAGKIIVRPDHPAAAAATEQGAAA
jgi:threonine 3-dehydrogenase